MITIEKLKEYGANVEEGLGRCMNNEAFYIRLVEMVLPDDKLDILEQRISSGDLDGAFETAHSLKGMYGNLSLTPIYMPVYEITEHLRGRSRIDYSALLSEAKRQKKLLEELAKG
ncbi:MAG: Hpt domain-containing protein [Clostridia bacterium]|nr:Hpt domain-containing protein [Clostridia bacterium]